MNGVDDITQLLIAIGVVINALVAAFGAISSYRNGRQNERILESQNGIKDNVATIEKATNSMKDALVAATAKSSRAEGKAEGVAQERDAAKIGINPQIIGTAPEEPR